MSTPQIVLAAAESGEPTIHPYVVGGGALLILLAMLLVVVMIGGGREHS